MVLKRYTRRFDQHLCSRAPGVLGSGVVPEALICTTGFNVNRTIVSVSCFHPFCLLSRCSAGLMD